MYKRYIFRLLIFERVSISLVGAYERAGKSFILVSERTTQGLTGYLFLQKRFIKGKELDIGAEPLHVELC